MKVVKTVYEEIKGHLVKIDICSYVDQSTGENKLKAIPHLVESLVSSELTVVAGVNSTIYSKVIKKCKDRLYLLEILSKHK